jgi:hypothetical protein
MPSSSSRNRNLFIGASLFIVVALYFGWQWAGQDNTPLAVVKNDAPKTGTESVKSADALSSGSSSKTVMNGGPDRLITVEEGDVMIDEILRSNSMVRPR